MALTYPHAFEIELRHLVEAEIKTIGENLAAGCAKDHSEYLRQVGRVMGLRSALDHCTAVHEKLDKER